MGGMEKHGKKWGKAEKTDPGGVFFSAGADGKRVGKCGGNARGGREVGGKVRENGPGQGGGGDFWTGMPLGPEGKREGKCGKNGTGRRETDADTAAVPSRGTNNTKPWY